MEKRERQFKTLDTAGDEAQEINALKRDLELNLEERADAVTQIYAVSEVFSSKEMFEELKNNLRKFGEAGQLLVNRLEVYFKDIAEGHTHGDSTPGDIAEEDARDWTVEKENGMGGIIDAIKADPLFEKGLEEMMSHVNYVKQKNGYYRHHFDWRDLANYVNKGIEASALEKETQELQSGDLSKEKILALKKNKRVHGLTMQAMRDYVRERVGEQYDESGRLVNPIDRRDDFVLVSDYIRLKTQEEEGVAFVKRVAAKL